uniref:MATE1 n=1 Tax=Arundo donax TaxID=35708 RepID=A0A0A9GP85_ARUDO
MDIPTAASSTGPMWPMKAVSTSEATGSAMRASAPGTAIPMISWPMSSHLNTNLAPRKKTLSGWCPPSSMASPAASVCWSRRLSPRRQAKPMHHRSRAE